ncbi:MAG: glutamate formimidoyltransferase [Chloroflexota bacterium]|nr:glutamate formimidoyltransferase [Chloroflexota bacterium]
METLVECVPNISEGSDESTLDAISAVIDDHAGAWLLDRTADPDHDRSVFTMAGYPGRVMGAMEAALKIAIERVDMRQQQGRHPRIGAVDVIPFIPLGDTTMEQCVAGAREFAERIADRFELPVYLYAEAARRPERRVLAKIRRPGFEGLAEAMAEPDRVPDFGPARPHPSAGATVVGARPFLLAFNIQLSTTDVAVAKRIAGRIRERDGGLPAVQALGIDLASQGCVQLSMNILDHERTPLWRVWEEAERLASDERTSLLDSELIGLAPAAALVEVADHIGSGSFHPAEHRITEAAGWLRIRRFDPNMVLEVRLARARDGS